MTNERHAIEGRNLALHAFIAGLSTAFEQASIDHIVLRGPVDSDWLAAHVEPYSSIDVDVLVPEPALLLADATLRNLGYAPVLRRETIGSPLHAMTYEGTGFPIDLHWDLVGCNSGPTVLWRTIGADTHRSSPSGYPVPDRVDAALILALHVAQHGGEHRRSSAQLRAAVSVLPHTVWLNAKATAEVLDAGESLAAGLQLVEATTLLNDLFGASTSIAAPIALRAQAPPPTAQSFGRLEALPTRRTRLAFLVRKVIPETDFMKVWRPRLARVPGVGLALAYLYRPFWLAFWAPQGYLAWRRAKRAAAESRRKPLSAGE